MRRRVQARPSRSRRATSSSARVLAVKAATSTRSAGGSSSAATRRSGGGRRAPRVLVEAAGQAGGAGALGAEAGGQVGPWQAGQVAEGAQAEADQQVGEVGAVEGGHREGARKARLPPGGTMAWWRAARPAAKVPSAIPTRHPTPRPTGGPPRRSPGPPRPHEGRVDGGRHGDGQGRLAAVVAGGAAGREGALARLEDLDPGGEPLDRHQHRLEGAGVAGRVVGEQLQLRAAALGLAPAQAGPDALGPRGRRAGDDAVGVDDGGQAVRRRPGGHHRPVGAPDHHHPGHRRSPGVGQGSSRRPVRPRRGIPFPGEGQAGWAPLPNPGIGESRW